MSKKHRQPTPYSSADRKLDPAQFMPLNIEFYQGFHQEAATGRLGVLCLMHQKPEVIEGLLADGVSWGLLELKRQPDERSDEALRSNAELELVALRQHTAEVLFRVFWVHAHREPCPWIALARLRNPGDLKDAAERYLKGRLWDDQTQRSLFHARALWSSMAIDESGQLRDGYVANADTVALWIEVAARLVRDAPLYSAYKHGMAVVHGDPFTMSITPPDGSPGVALQASAGFRYITRGTDEERRRHYWQLVSEPINFEAAAAETAAFSTILATVLDVGAIDRGVTKLPQQVAVFNADATPARIRNDTARPGMAIERFADSLAYLQ